MRRFSFLGIATLTSAVLLATATQVKALRIAVPQSNPTQQAIQAEVIVVGKVNEIEKEMSQATQFPGNPMKVDYHVGVIKISENIVGAKGLTTIRVGFLPAPKVQPGPVGGPAIQPIRRPPFVQQVVLTEG